MDEINLYDLNARLLDDCAFSLAALDKLYRIQSRLPECLHSTYTTASSASALLDHWLVERKLDCYERGRKVDDVTAISLSAPDQDYGRAMDISDAFTIIRCDELVSLLKKEGMPIPAFLTDEDDKLADDKPEVATDGMVAWQAVMIESWPEIAKAHKGKPKPRNAMQWLKRHGPRAVIPEKQPDHNALQWLDLSGNLQTVALKSIQSRVSEWRKARIIPPET